MCVGTIDVFNFSEVHIAGIFVVNFILWNQGGRVRETL